QPRQVFDSSKITELAESIDEHGLLQPIVVRPIEENMYEIIAGERRFRALQSLHKSQADVNIRHMNDEETAVVALIENIQRENLSAVEEAEAYKKLLEIGGTTQSELAKSLGKSQ
ncbi:ParB/RepB/Spo0J family partition protein, partial [Staphylococcus aureus]|nr:ParB/RepB/Spo0J family partition protein [Staphylococcus aureus]